MNNQFYFDDGQLEELTFSVYGKPISITGTQKGKSYHYDVHSQRLEADHSVMQAVEDGFMHFEGYGVILQDICSKGLIQEGQYHIVIF